MGLERATRLTAMEDSYSLVLDPAWDIWGPAGGYIAAIALRAVGEKAPVGHRPLTLTGQFVSVARPGSIDVFIEPVKVGGTCLYAVRLCQGDRTVFLAQVWTTARAEPVHMLAPRMPEVPAPETCIETHAFFAQRGQTEITFWRNIEGRLVNPRWPDDPPPSNPRQLRWMRFQDWASTDDPFLEATRSTLLIDIGVWPAHWHRLAEPATYVAPSLDLTVWFHGEPAAGEWLLSEADSDVAGNGSISGQVRIWSADGRAIATGGGHCLVLTPKA